jgi:hypothetical protein
MAAQIAYRHEYLTGFAMAQGFSPMNVAVMAYNPGPFEEHVRAQGVSADGRVRFDSDDLVVEPHRAQFAIFDMLEPFEGPVGYRVQILTTSTNLILSVGDPNGTGVLEVPQREPIVPFPYYGPNDFVVLPLRVRPPVTPPTGPVENA